MELRELLNIRKNQWPTKIFFVHKVRNCDEFENKEIEPLYTFSNLYTV